ncbi:MAG: cytochrome P450 [Anaerolineae bacterium]|nr:cytochrome P450 [Anaerolineae bacterium]MDW8098427.1 cytochrome P450 [Anaerolineae bacterium]
MTSVQTAPLSPPTIAHSSASIGLSALLRILRGDFGGILPILEMMHREIGDVFQLNLPGFSPVVIAGPQALRQVLVDDRDAYLWRPNHDPVARLLRRGILVTDGEEHARLRRIMDPSSHRKHFIPRSRHLWQLTDRVVDTWQPGRRYDMLVEMRKLALLIFEDVFFSHDLLPELDAIWQPMLKTLAYISPGMWVLTGAGDPPRETRALNQHLFTLLRRRRTDPNPPDDLLTHLIQNLDDDELVRDQMLTMLIAGHDTSTALLTWTLYLLGQHRRWFDAVQEQIRDELGRQPPTPENVGRLTVLDQVIKESLRLYPPIHVGNRFTAREVELSGYRVPAGTRIMVSYYLVQRHAAYWEEAAAFRPERWQGEFRPAPFTYVPFGGGPRNCIGSAFAQLETRLVLARILQRYDLTLCNHRVSTYMGATLEPRPGVIMEVHPLT